MFFNIPQIQYKNPWVQIMLFKNMTPSPFLRFYLGTCRRDRARARPVLRGLSGPPGPVSRAPAFPPAPRGSPVPVPRGSPVPLPRGSVAVTRPRPGLFRKPCSVSPAPRARAQRPRFQRLLCAQLTCGPLVWNGLCATRSSESG